VKLRRTALLVVLALGLPACSGDAIDGEPTGPQNADVAGQWNYLAMDLIGEILLVSVRCAVVGGVDLSQQNGTFSGTLFGRAIECEVPNLTLETGDVGDVQIINGVLTGAQVEFDYSVPFQLPEILKLVEAELGAPVTRVTFTFHHEGTVSGNSMSGAVTVNGEAVITGASRPGTFVLAGSWSATR